MQRPAARLVEVELVEVDAFDAVGDDGGPGGSPAPPLRSALGRVPREVVLTAVAALLLGGAGVAVARVGAERALDARLAEVPGLTSSLGSPLREDWRAPGGGLVATLDDLVVHWDHDGLGVVGTDVADGSTRYAVPGMCQLAPTEGDLSDRFTGFGPAFGTLPGDVLLCVEGGGAGSLGVFSAQEATAHVVDPATGETRHSFTMVAGDTWNVVDGDVVSIGLDVDQRVVAGRWSLRTGEQRWAHHGTEVVPAATGGGWGTTMSNGTIGLELGTWSVTLDVETGAETQASAVGGDPEFVQTARLPDGGSLEYSASASGSMRTTVHRADGGDPVTVPGVVLPPAVDDGSAPGTAVVLDVDDAAGSQGFGLVDLASGERRWTTSDVQGGEVGILSGLVLVADGTQTVALDARTGETRWESTTGSTAYFAGWELVTDGRRVLVVDGVGTDREIVALDVRTGERMWGIEPPFTDAALVPLLDGTVLVVGPYEMVALRP